MLAECRDVMVAHSPPSLFAAAARHTAPPELSVLYQNFRLVITQNQQSPATVRRCNPRTPSPLPTSVAEDFGLLALSSPATAGPRRPCLVIRTDSDGSIGSSSDENEPLSPARRKKKVVFADDRGLSLTQVRSAAVINTACTVDYRGSLAGTTGRWRPPGFRILAARLFVFELIPTLKSSVVYLLRPHCGRLGLGVTFPNASCFPRDWWQLGTNRNKQKFAFRTSYKGKITGRIPV